MTSITTMVSSTAKEDPGREEEGERGGREEGGEVVRAVRFVGYITRSRRTYLKEIAVDHTHFQ